MRKTSLRDRTLELLLNRNVQLTFKKIEEDTKLDEGWLSMFSRNKIPDPSVNSIQTLYEYLANTELKLN